MALRNKPREPKAVIKEQPSAVESEAALIGACLLDPTICHTVFGVIGLVDRENTPCVREEHTEFMMSLSRLSEKGEKIDMVSVIAEIRSFSGYPQDRLIQLTDLLQSFSALGLPANFERYLGEVMRAKRKRDFLFSIERAKAMILDPSFEDEDAVDEIERALFESRTDQRHEPTSYREGGIEGYKEITDPAAVQQRGVPSGIIALDNLTNGWQRGDLILIGARPSRGKSSLAHHLWTVAGHSGVPTLVFTLEMTKKQIWRRAYSYDAGINSHWIRDRNLGRDQYDALRESRGRITSLPIFIDDKGGISITELKSKARRYKLQHNVGLVMVDYLQIMSAGKGFESREREVNHIGASLKALAKELDIPVIAMVQLNKECIGRVPKGSDLRESDSLLHHCDLLLLIDDYHDSHLPKRDGERSYALGERVDLILEKQRDGEVGTVPVKFDRSTSRFEDDVPPVHFPVFEGSAGTTRPTENLPF